MTSDTSSPDTSTKTFSARAVLFDMDGTLVDSTGIVEQVWSEFAQRYGLDLEEILRTSHGVQAGDTVRRFAPADADVAALTAELGHMELNRTDGILAVTGAAALLEALPLDAVALVTSADRPLAEVRMAAAGLAMPSTVITAEGVSRGKPDPEGYLAAAAMLGVEPADAVVFEDAPAGIAAAQAAGMRVVVVGSAAEVPRGSWRIHDYSGITASASNDADGRRIITFRVR